MEIAKNNQLTESGIYEVLLILTDGEIMDMAQTKNLISKCSRLPMSIVIIGIGNANFSNMEILDGDEVKISERDLV